MRFSISGLQNKLSGQDAPIKISGEAHDKLGGQLAGIANLHLAYFDAAKDNRADKLAQLVVVANDVSETAKANNLKPAQVAARMGQLVMTEANDRMGEVASIVLDGMRERLNNNRYTQPAKSADKVPPVNATMAYFDEMSELAASQGFSAVLTQVQAGQREVNGVQVKETRVPPRQRKAIAGALTQLALGRTNMDEATDNIAFASAKNLFDHKHYATRMLEAQVELHSATGNGAKTAAANARLKQLRGYTSGRTRAANLPVGDMEYSKAAKQALSQIFQPLPGGAQVPPQLARNVAGMASLVNPSNERDIQGIRQTLQEAAKRKTLLGRLIHREVGEAEQSGMSPAFCQQADQVIGQTLSGQISLRQGVTVASKALLADVAPAMRATRPLLTMRRATVGLAAAVALGLGGYVWTQRDAAPSADAQAPVATAPAAAASVPAASWTAPYKKFGSKLSEAIANSWPFKDKAPVATTPAPDKSKLWDITVPDAPKKAAPPAAAPASGPASGVRQFNKDAKPAKSAKPAAPASAPASAPVVVPAPAPGKNLTYT